MGGIGAGTIIMGGWGGIMPGGGGRGAMGSGGCGGGGAGTGGGGGCGGWCLIGSGADPNTGLGPIFSFSSSGSSPFTLCIWWICSSMVMLARAALVAASTLEVCPSHVTFNIITLYQSQTNTLMVTLADQPQSFTGVTSTVLIFRY